MEIPKYKTALIVGAGEGLSASLARLFAREGIKVALAARKISLTRRSSAFSLSSRRFSSTISVVGRSARSPASA